MRDLGRAHSLAAVVSGRNRVRQKTNFASPFNPIPPVQSSPEKYSAFVFSEIAVPSSHPALDREGRFAIVTSVERGMRWTLQCEALMRDDSRGDGRPSRVVLASRR
jgi:hypothetical protein